MVSSLQTVGFRRSPNRKARLDTAGRRLETALGRGDFHRTLSPGARRSTADGSFADVDDPRAGRPKGISAWPLPARLAALVPFAIGCIALILFSDRSGRGAGIVLLFVLFSNVAFDAARRRDERLGRGPSHARRRRTAALAVLVAIAVVFLIIKLLR